MGSKVETLVHRIRYRLDDWGGDGDLDNTEWKYDDTHTHAKTELLIECVADAQKEFCRRNPISDTETVTLLDATAEYSVPTYVRTIEEITLAYDGRKLAKYFHHYDTDDFALPDDYAYAYREDLKRFKIEVFPVPATATLSTLTLTVKRLPKVRPTKLSDTLELEGEHDDAIVLWALSQMYTQQNTHPNALNWAAYFRSRFTDLAGPPIDEGLAQIHRNTANKRLRVTAHYR